jgi:hypothetical protein
MCVGTRTLHIILNVCVDVSMMARQRQGFLQPKRAAHIYFFAAVIILCRGAYLGKW